MSFDRSDPLFVGESLALDFLNSIAAPKNTTYDWLETGADILDWMVQAGLCQSAELVLLKSGTGSDELEQAAHDICRFRETFRAFIHLAITEKAVPLDHPVIDEINRILADSSQVPKISRLGDPKLVTVHRYERATDLLPRIAVECARFICEADFRYIRVCEGPSCTLLFLDISKNHRRRWCSMEVCGNRAKAAAYRKSKAERPS